MKNPARMRVTRTLLLLSLLLTARAAAAQTTLDVPDTPTVPILLDGQLPAGEWDDAHVQPLAGGLRLLLKEHAGDVFLAVHTGTRVPRPVDLYLQLETGEVVQLHASMQVGERVLPVAGWSDTVPAWRWGNHADWIANEAKLDSAKPRGAGFEERLFPADGVEFQVRRARFAGRSWRLRVDVGAFTTAGRSDRFPAGATDDPATWALVRLPAA